MKYFVLVLAVIGTLYTLPAFFPVLNKNAFNVGQFYITYTYLLLAGVLFAGYKLKD